MTCRGAGTDVFSTLPLSLLPNTLQNGADTTIYTVRLKTSQSRGSYLSDSNACVNILLVSSEKDSDGQRRSVMQRIKPYRDNLQLVEERPRRFQEGSVDEISFHTSEDLGSLAGILVGTESGTWRLEEAIVSSSTSGHVDRFVSRETTMIGSETGLGALWLVPLPDDMVQYGSGDSATLLSSTESKAMRQLNLAAYEENKKKVLSTTVALTAGGTFIALACVGPDSTMWYAYGGLVGLAYQWMLQVGVDGVVDKRPQPLADDLLNVEAARQELEEINTLTIEVERQGTFVARLKGIVGNPALRLGFVATAVILAFTLWSGPGPEGGEGDSSQVNGMLGLLGFFSYKIALFLEEFSPSSKSNLIK